MKMATQYLLILLHSSFLWANISLRDTDIEDFQNQFVSGNQSVYLYGYPISFKIFEPCHEKTGFLHMRKQRRRSASR